MNNEIFLNNFTLVADHNCTTPDGYPFRERVWRGGGHEIIVHEDEYGYHAKIDNGRVAANLDAAGLMEHVAAHFGRR